MDSHYLQTLRYKLQKRVRRLNSANHEVFPILLRQWWGFLQSESLCRSILDRLEAEATQSLRHEVESLLQGQSRAFLFDTEKEHIAAAYFLLKTCVEADNFISILTKFRYLDRSANKLGEHLDIFRDVFLEPFYDYLDENLDNAIAVLGFLIRYKRRCEWFHRKTLYDAWYADTKNGEKRLALDLYEYLYAQGLDFSIEPWSTSGEADLVASQQGDDRLIADAKIFDPGKSKGKSYIAHGVRQIYQYTLDYNSPVGYLVIFKTCEQDLRLALPETTSHVPFFTHNNKTLFLLTIDIYQYGDSASKRGRLQATEMTDTDILSLIDTPDPDLSEEPTTP